jgi:pyruvate formate lyase activating enzyme
VSNALILENLKALGRAHDTIWIRVPVVAGFNDAPGDMDALAHLAASTPGVRRVNLLPYHALGEHKGERPGRVSPWESISTPHPKTSPLWSAASAPLG